MKQNEWNWTFIDLLNNCLVGWLTDWLCRSEEIEKMMQEKEFTLNLFGGGKMLDGITQYMNADPEMELVNKFPIDKDMNTILYVAGGTALIDKCLLSLK